MLFSRIIERSFDAVLGRYDGDPAQYYFTPSDFPGLQTEPFEADGSQGKLRGYFYSYGEPASGRLIIFDHGIGAGHRAYLKEIEYLARNGYTVCAYDHTGCVESEGRGILGFAQGINDLDRVLRKVREDARFGNSGLRVMGHSWGGYSAMNAAAFHPEITHVVSLAGFLSARALIEQYLPKFVMSYSSEVMERERRHNPDYADMDARASMKKSKAALLHLQSGDDKKVKFELCTPLLSEALQGRGKTQFIILDRRNHDPQRTEEAAAAAEEMQNCLDSLRKKKKLNTKEEQEAFKKSRDWELITRQDPIVWDKILKFLDC
ncbi:MAG: alpha/beta hydrolase family protein [Candidatus Limivicinus sp.]|jgi:dienelactone hydrolase